MAGNGVCPCGAGPGGTEPAGEGLAGGDGPPGRGDCGAAGEIRTFLHSAQWRPQLLPGRTMPEKGDHGGVGPGLGGGQFAHRFTTLSFCGLYLSLGDASCSPVPFWSFNQLSDPGQKSAAVCHSPAAWGGQADPEPLDGLGTGDLFSSSRFSCRPGVTGPSECGCPAADGACGFAARGVSPVWRRAGSGDLRRGVRPSISRCDLPAVPAGVWDRGQGNRTRPAAKISRRGAVPCQEGGYLPTRLKLLHNLLSGMAG